MGKINSHRDLIIYQKAFKAAMEIFELTKKFPKEEMYSLVDQIRRSSRSVAANLAEAFRKRYYPKYFVAKIIDIESEAAETQVWLEFAYRSNYIDKETTNKLYQAYNEIISMAVTMKIHPDQWTP